MIERLHGLLKELRHLGVEVRLDGSDLHVKGGANLTAELCDEIAGLRPELIEYLRTEGETVIDEDAVITNNTPPRSPEEVDKQRAAADRTRERVRQNGQLLVNDPDAMRYSAYMTQLVRQRERREAIERERREALERGEPPPDGGHYKTGWDLFNRREYE